MKFILKLLFLSSLVGCANTSPRQDCEGVKVTVKEKAAGFYNEDPDKKSVEPIIKRWEQLIDYLCSNLDLGGNFYVVQVGGKEGLLYAKTLNKFYYFKRNGADINVNPRREELKTIQSFILKLDKNPDLSHEIVSKTVTVSDIVSTDILYIETNARQKSYFISVPYSSYIQ